MAHKVFQMPFAKICQALLNKVERKGKTKEQLDQLIGWLTGYGAEGLQVSLNDARDFQTFFAQAPKLNPDRHLIKGVVCGVRVENIEDPLMQNIRYLDKFVDELARGKKYENILHR